MVNVFFICSSPYVGYTLRKADYVQKAMLPCTQQDMTALGYKVFNSSGSYMVLGTFEGRRYFHTRQSESEHYDEQGRRIYANIAFLGSNAGDTAAINAIAAYAFFEEEAFYAEMADMITLRDDGFTVDFVRLTSFLKRFENKCTIETQSAEAERVFRAITAGSGELDLIVRESTWSYFVKQVDYDFHDSIGIQLSYTEAKELSGKAAIRFTDTKKPTEKTPSKEAPKHPADAEKKPSTPPRKEQPAEKSSTEKENIEKSPEQKKLEDKFSGLLYQNNNQKKLLDAAEQKAFALKNEIARLKEKLKQHFLLGLLVGIVGTVIAVLMIRALFGK